MPLGNPRSAPPACAIDASCVDFGVLVTDEPLNVRHLSPDNPTHDRKHPARRVSRCVWSDCQPSKFKSFSIVQ
jgi:hypothetical protein